MTSSSISNAKGSVRRRSKPPPECIYCGNPATTKDHVPPKNIFLEPRPSNLITVPACHPCNNGASRWDEGFRNIISMRGGVSSAQSLALWKKTLRSLHRNKPELERLRKSMRDVPVFTPAGIYLGHATEGQLEAEPHDRTIERITRGLYFHHFGEAVPHDSRIEVIFIRDGAEWRQFIAPLLQLMQVRDIGGRDVFEYAFGRAADKPEASLWIYRFYAGHIATASTGTIAYRGA